MPRQGGAEYADTGKVDLPRCVDRPNWNDCNFNFIDLHPGWPLVRSKKLWRNCEILENIGKPCLLPRGRVSPAIDDPSIPQIGIFRIKALMRLLGIITSSV